jgi:hypothetical protein
MKKVVIAAFTLVTLGAVSANAQTTTPASQTQTEQTAPASQTTPPAQAGSQAGSTATTTSDDKTSVALDQLPDQVKATLASPSLKAWTATEAFLVKGADGKEYFAINVKKDNETGSIQLDKEGKPVK